MMRRMTGVIMGVMGLAAGAATLTGEWRGELSVGAQKLPLVFNFSKTPGGETLVSLKSPAQSAKGIPAKVDFCSTDSIAISCEYIRATYNGKIYGDEKIDGAFRQAGYSFPLVLSPAAPLSERRPQTPQPPFPYSVTDTMFTAPDGAILAGTLTLPANTKTGKTRAVVMVTGSGPQNRDEELMEHRPFAVIADGLARQGIASFRYDDRGTASSGGDFKTATTFTLKDDAASAVEFLKSMKIFDKVGVIGHSEGGTIAFLLGADDTPDFIVTLAGMAEPGKQLLLRQNRHSLSKTPFEEKDRRNTLRLIELMFDEIELQHAKGVSTTIELDSLACSKKLSIPPEMLLMIKASAGQRNGWFDSFVSLNPEEYLKKITCPVLAINGDKDTQVDADANLEIIKRNAKDADVRKMTGLNHLLQHAVTGEVDEYTQIKETISPEVLSIIAEWIIGL